MAVAYSHIEKNKRNSLILALLFPLSVMLFTYLAVTGFYLLLGVLSYYRPTAYMTFGSTLRVSCAAAWDSCQWILPLVFLISAFWAYIALKDGDQFIIDMVPRARRLPSWEEDDAHRMLENLCITVGVQIPQLYVLEEETLNAFSVGVRPERSAIVLSSGLLKKLNRQQLEGVLAHELSHIRNYDVRLMTMLIMCLAFFTFAGEYFVYGTEKKDAESVFEPRRVRVPVLIYVGFMLLGYGYFIAPFLRFAFSHTREKLADAQAALMTRNPRALAQALWLISENSHLSSISHSELLGLLCIDDPSRSSTFFARVSGIMLSHPPIGERMRALNDMDGLFLNLPVGPDVNEGYEKLV